jgi:hypothetical protein
MNDKGAIEKREPIKVYHVEDIEKSKTTEGKFTLADSVALLISRRPEDERFTYRSEGGLEFMQLRYVSRGTYEDPFQLLFKRCPELKPYCAKIRSWLKDEKIDWQDIVINGDKFICAKLNASENEVIEKLERIQQEVFGFENIKIQTPNPRLSIALHGNRHPLIGVVAGFSFVISIVALGLYDLYKLPTFCKPSILNLEWVEVFLVITFFTSLAAVRYCMNSSLKKRREKKFSFKQVSMGRLAFLTLLVMPLFTA